MYYLQRNTFQCVIATNENLQRSFVIFFYADGKIQWTTGDNDGGENGLGGVYAQVGFNKGDGVKYSVIPESQTEDVIKLDERSNVDRAGVFMFEISNEEIPVNQSIISIHAY